MTLADQIANLATTVAAAIRGHAPTPMDHGALAWTNDPTYTGTFAPAAGRIQCKTFRAAKSGTVTKIGIQVTTAQTITGLIKLGIYDLAGNLLGSTVDVKASFTTTGYKELALSAGVALTLGAQYVLAWLCVSTGTPPTVISSIGSSGPTMGQTVGTSAPMRQVQGPTGATDLPSTINWVTGTFNTAVGNGIVALMKP